MKAVMLSLIVVVDLSTATLRIEHPELKMETPVVVGKHSSPTPTGVYLLKKAYSTKLQMPVFVFMQDGNQVYAIHPNLSSRTTQLQSAPVEDNALSAGCIGLAPAQFDRLWNQKQTLILQVHE